MARKVRLLLRCVRKPAKLTGHNAIDFWLVNIDTFSGFLDLILFTQVIKIVHVYSQKHGTVVKI